MFPLFFSHIYSLFYTFATIYYTKPLICEHIATTVNVLQILGIMITVILEFDVEDFIAWKKIFDSNNQLRIKNQIIVIGTYVSMRDADHVVCVVEAPSITAFEEHFFGHSEVSENLKEKAIIKEPNIKYYNKVNR